MKYIDPTSVTFLVIFFLFFFAFAYHPSMILHLTHVLWYAIPIN